MYNMKMAMVCMWFVVVVVEFFGSWSVQIS